MYYMNMGWVGQGCLIINITIIIVRNTILKCLTKCYGENNYDLIGQRNTIFDQNKCGKKSRQQQQEEPSKRFKIK